MSIEIVNSLDEITWRKFITDHPQANIFHTPEMFAVFSKAHGHSPFLWAAIDSLDQVCALLLPVRVTLRNGLFYPWTTRAVAYGSILCAPGKTGEEGLRLLLNVYARASNGKILFTELRNSYPVDGFKQVLNQYKYTYEDHFNYLVDLTQSEETLWRNLSKSCRQRIRIAESNGTTIEEVTSPHQLLIAYRLLQELYSRIQIPLAHMSLFQAAFDLCSPLGMCKVFLARKDDHYIGCSFVLLNNGKILAWYSASDRHYSSDNPGELLKWHIFKWGKANGQQIFDFGGAGKPGQPYGPREFKAKFGGELVNFGRNICIHSPLRFQVSKLVYSIARKATAFG